MLQILERATTNLECFHVIRKATQIEARIFDKKQIHNFKMFKTLLVFAHCLRISTKLHFVYSDFFGWPTIVQSPEKIFHPRSSIGNQKFVYFDIILQYGLHDVSTYLYSLIHLFGLLTRILLPKSDFNSIGDLHRKF